MDETVVGFETANFAVDAETRTITGLLLPFGVVSRPARDTTGKVARYQFSEDTVDVGDLEEDPVILNFGHDTESLDYQVGVARELTKKSDGIYAKFRIASTPAGDTVLALAHPDVRILRSFSAEVAGEYEDKDGVRHSKATTVVGGAVVRKPAFVGANITSVAAAAAQEDRNPAMTEPEKDTAALLAEVQALSEKVAELQNIKIPVGPGAQVEVKEEPIYRFAGVEAAPSGFDFATDLLSAANGDQVAFKRIQEFSAENLTSETPHFVTTGNIDELNQPAYRPDMFIGQAPTPQSPLYDTFHKGTLSNVTPFFWTKLDRANTTVAVHDHTEGVEPNPDNFVTATGTTVTPTAVSGKVHITREVADQGGNPQVSGLIWSEFERSFKIALETKTGQLLAAAAGAVASLTAAIAAGASGVAAGRAIEAGLIDLQFLPDGSRYTKAFGHYDLYKALSMAVIPKFSGDIIGEKLYPIINPQNRDGIAGSKYSFIDLAGYRMEPCPSLGATSVNASNSFVADPNAVHVWNSGLTKLEKLQERVEGWDLGVFAYFAGVVYDPTGLRKISYDPTA